MEAVTLEKACECGCKKGIKTTYRGIICANCGRTQDRWWG